MFHVPFSRSALAYPTVRKNVTAALNRMSTEPDFKRLLTEFALVEFKRKIGNQEVIEALKADYTYADQSSRSKKEVLQHFGTEPKWTAINSAVWTAITVAKDHLLTLSDVDAVANEIAVEPNDVLAVLALLSRQGSSLMKMDYVAYADGDSSMIGRDEVTKKLRAWWKDKSMSEEEWRSWSEGVVVRWSVAERLGEAR
jgi:hypothetical protein